MLCNLPKANQTGDKYKVYNIGNNSHVKVMDFIDTLEKALGKMVEKIFPTYAV